MRSKLPVNWTLRRPADRRGMGVKEIDVQAKADKRDKNITSVVKKILKDFPPKAKS